MVMGPPAWSLPQLSQRPMTKTLIWESDQVLASSWIPVPLWASVCPLCQPWTTWPWWPLEARTLGDPLTRARVKVAQGPGKALYHWPFPWGGGSRALARGEAGRGDEGVGSVGRTGLQARPAACVSCVTGRYLREGSCWGGHCDSSQSG